MSSAGVAWRAFRLGADVRGMAALSAGIPRVVGNWVFMVRRPGVAAGRRAGARGDRAVFAALDLGTNNCRLLVAESTYGPQNFRVLDGFSQIVRLGEGVSQTGQLGPGPMRRAHDALARCAACLAHYPMAVVRAVATEACRAATNGPAFLQEVATRTGINFVTIPAAEEAALSALGCADLIVPGAEVALVVDVGGGSTEFTWVDARRAREALRTGAIEPAILAWMSVPIGVVTLAEAAQAGEDMAGLRSLVRRALRTAPEAETMARLFTDRPGMLIGASGAVTSLAGVSLGLTRYSRARVDGMWLSADEFATVAHTIQTMSQAARNSHPCIGEDRADLVGPGAAIMQAVLEVWPFARLRVADRGLREGLLTKMIAETRVQS